MQLRTLAAATLLTLQAFVASRPFVASASVGAANVGTASSPHDGGHASDRQELAASAQPDCHHATAGSGTHESARQGSAPSPEQSPVVPAPHDHGDTACHAGTPCCAPTLPVPAIELPMATVAATRSSVAPSAVLWRAPALARRLPPATAPPARS